MTKVTLLNLTEAAAREILRDCAADDRRVFYSPHARKRMKERGITMPQVLSCLTKGRVTEPPHRDLHGDWRLTLTHYTTSSVVNAAVAIKYNEKGERTVIVTVF